MKIRDIQAILEQLPEICDRFDISSDWKDDAWFADSWLDERLTIRVDLGSLEHGCNLYFRDNVLVRAVELHGSYKPRELL